MSKRQIPLGPENIFIKVKNSDEKKSIIEGLAKDKKEILIKSSESGGDVFAVKCISLVRDQLTCSLPKEAQNLKNLSKVTLQFTAGHEKYLASASASLNGDIISIDLNTDIFQLQRREDFRLKLPLSYKANFETEKINNEPKSLSFKIIDISAGGCRVETSRQQIEMHTKDLLVGSIVLSKRPKISINAEIKHLASHPEDNQRIMAGLQFINVSSTAKDKLVGVVMDIYRELFSKI